MTSPDSTSNSTSNTTSSSSSRIILKNLPKYCTLDMLRKHISTHLPSATITDLKLAHTADGKFRRFAFAGFGSPEEASRAQKYFNGTYFDTLRMQVDVALPVGSAELPRAWSRYTKAKEALYEESNASSSSSSSTTDSDAIKRAEEEKKRRFLFSIYGADVAAESPEEAAELEKYLNSMRSKTQTRTWENDGDSVQDLSHRKKKVKGVQVQVQSVNVKKAGGAGLLVPKVHMKFADEQAEEDFFEKSEDEDLYEDFPRKDTNDEESIGEVDEVEKAIESEKSEKLTQSNQSNTPSSTANKANTPSITSNAVDGKHNQLDPALIAETGRLFLRNLSYTCTEDDLKALFTPFGPLSAIHIPITADTKKPKGFAYVLFAIPDDAVRAYTRLDGTIFQGRLLHILPAHEQPVKEVSSSEGNSSYKAQKEAQLKSQSGSTHNWNSLFIRADTVLDAVAAKLGVPKSSIMSTDSTSGDSMALATRLAVAETHIIQETKEYLLANGVQLDAFSSSSTSSGERSNTVILVKNLPFQVEEDELKKLFGKFGTLERVILPPVTKSIAMIEFLEPNEAKSAFRSLAYSKFHAAPLFLEWAPLGALTKRIERTETVEKIESSTINAQSNTTTTPAETTTQSSTTTSQSPTCTLFIKNLSFNTIESSLQKLFSSIGPVRSVRIPRKQPGNLSMGFGFVEFTCKEDVNRAIDRLQGSQLDGHALELKLQAVKEDKQAPTKQRKSTSVLSEEELAALKPTKLLLRNIPFEANEKELRSLITSFTPALKRLRLPKKFDGSLRGFGFAEFTAHGEAKHVMEQLSSTHFYGRHLVIEWAKTEDGEERA